MAHTHLPQTSLCLSGTLLPLEIPTQLLHCCLLVWKEKSSRRRSKSPAHLLLFCIISWRLKAWQGGGQPALQAAYECCLFSWHEASWAALWWCGTAKWIGWRVVSMLECSGCWLRGVMEPSLRHALSSHWFSRLFSSVCLSLRAFRGQGRMNEPLVITTTWIQEDPIGRVHQQLIN